MFTLEHIPSQINLRSQSVMCQHK